MDLYITDSESLTFFSNMSLTTDPDIRTLFPAAQLRVTDKKGRAYETITYGIAFKPDKLDSFQATLTAHTWTAGPVTLVPKTK